MNRNIEEIFKKRIRLTPKKKTNELREKLK